MSGKKKKHDPKKNDILKTQETSASKKRAVFPHSCTDCGVLNCSKRNAFYPEFCLTEKLTK